MSSFYRWLAWYLPHDLVRWCAIRLMAHATSVFSDREAGAITMFDALSAWDGDLT